MENYKRLPFAAYDLAVYIPGGVVFYVFISQLLSKYYPNVEIFSHIPVPDDTIGNVIRGIIWLSGSYLAGHLVAFASSYLIEKFVHRTLGYPSTVWLQIEKQYRTAGSVSESDLKSIFSANVSKSRVTNFAQFVVMFAQFPVALIYLLMFRLRIYGYYVTKLPLGLLDKLSTKAVSVGITTPIEAGTRWEKLIEHYVANNSPLAYGRMYNYLIIYGALRILALLNLCIVWVMLFENVCSVYQHGPHFNFENFVRYTGASIVYVTSVMAFAKFNRRYFEECVLAFVLSDAKSA